MLIAYFSSWRKVGTDMEGSAVALDLEGVGKTGSITREEALCFLDGEAARLAARAVRIKAEPKRMRELLAEVRERPGIGAIGALAWMALKCAGRKCYVLPQEDESSEGSELYRKVAEAIRHENYAGAHDLLSSILEKEAPVMVRVVSPLLWDVSSSSNPVPFLGIGTEELLEIYTWLCEVENREPKFREMP